MHAPSLSQRLNIRETPHRFPMMEQTWENLLFIHWLMDPSYIQKTLPPGLYVDTYKGNAYIGIVAFEITKLSVGPFSLPFFSKFLEINMRTYVYDKNGTPGIWFYSLDIDSLISAEFARTTFGLPYFYSNLSKSLSKNLSYFLKRDKERLEISYEHKDTDFFENPSVESLEFFLIERYVLFSKWHNKLFEGRVSHKPYPLEQVNLLKDGSELFEWNGLKKEGEPCHVIFSKGVDVDLFNLTLV